jgi:phosphonate transport system substrate-binding protein
MLNIRRYLVLVLLLAGGTVGVIIAVRVVSDYGWQSALKNRSANKTTIRIDAQMKTKEVPQEGSSTSLPLLRIAIAPVISPEETYVNYRELVEYLGEVVGRRGQLMIRSTYGEVNELLRERRCDAALICTLAYIRGKREFGVRLLAAPVVKGNLYYHSHILVPESSPAKSLLDLEGKLFASADIMSTSGWMYPAVWLKKRGKDPLHYFKKHVISGSHDRSILFVAKGEVDGAAVDSLVYEQMSDEIKQKVRIIDTSQTFGMPPVVTPSKLDDGLRTRLLNGFLNAHRDPRGRAILSAIEIDRFEIVKDSLYDSIQKLEDQWQSEK